MEVKYDGKTVQDAYYSKEVYQAYVANYGDCDEVGELIENVGECYKGEYSDGAGFAKALIDELDIFNEEFSWIELYIDYQAVWDCSLCYVYSESNGHYFRDI